MRKIRLIEILDQGDTISAMADFLNVSGKIVSSPAVEVMLSADFSVLTCPAYWKGREIAAAGELVDVVNAVEFMDCFSAGNEQSAQSQSEEPKPQESVDMAGGYDKGNGKIFGSSALKILCTLGTGYANYKHWLNSGDDDAAHFRIGNALDSLLCQKINKSFAVRESERSNAGKEINAKNKAKGYILLTEPEKELVYSMRDAIMNHPIASRFFDKNNPDLEFQHVEKWDCVLENGETIEKRATRDVAIKKNGEVVAFVDLKSTRETTAVGFMRQFRWLDYDIQAALYSETLDLDIECNHPLLSGFDYPVIYIAVSSSAPHHVFCVQLNAAVIASGSEKVEQALRNFSEGKEKESRGEYAGFCEVSSIEGFESYQDNSDIDFDSLIESEDIIFNRINNFGEQK